jgi:hypothetical protein
VPASRVGDVRRTGWQGSRAVTFELAGRALRITHYGNPFDERDVRGICGIAESTKDLTAIGRFGIGFKSVYTFTDRPEVHSGAEDFAIENFVLPIATPRISRSNDETVILIPLKCTDDAGHEEIAAGLGRLGASALLFLRQIEEIHWSVEGGRSGLYLRESKEIDAEVRRVTVIGQEHGETEVDEAWLVFSRPVTANGGGHCGHVEIAFSIGQEQKTKAERIQNVERSRLVAFFPTVLETHLGFLVQGPYRTTPSRDNVPRIDPWNQGLVGETAWLLMEALRWLRDHDLLDTMALQCLPLDPTKFGESSMFVPLFRASKQALSSEPLLPRFDRGHVPAQSARLARTQELRELFTPAQLAVLFGEEKELAWLSGDITQDRTPDLRRYLMQELGIAEVTPESILPKLDKPFLQAQKDTWILGLYHFLNGQPALRRRLEDLPLIRLENGSHVPPRARGQPQAFLPGEAKTGFPTVRASVCATETASEFLQSLGLTKPDPVDDVVYNVLPKYDQVDVRRADYEADIRSVLTAFATDSKGQRERLVDALSQTSFVMAVDAGDSSKCLSKPGEVYQATDRLKELFAGIADVRLVDDTYACLRGENVRALLDACGAVRYLRPIPDTSLSPEERSRSRAQAGHENTSGQNDRVTDWMLGGLQTLLETLPQLQREQRATRTRLLWEELAHLEERRSKAIFTGEYTWTHYGNYRTFFDAAFVRKLNETVWIPEANGTLRRPEFVPFDTLGWKPNLFLQSKIRFKAPIMEALAHEARIELGALELLKKLGVTTEAELRVRLGLKDEPTPPGDGSPDNVEDALKKLIGDGPGPTSPVPDPAGAEAWGSAGGGGRAGGEVGSGTGSGHGVGATGRRPSAEPDKGTEADAGKRTPASEGGRPFISYVGVHPDEEEPDFEGRDQWARIALEAQSIDLILSREPEWKTTPTHNPGYDLFEAGEDGQATRWCEVKAMAGSLRDRPVGLSRTQFEHAQEHGEAYWLYIVEHAGTDGARIVRIQDPAGKARTFTFDYGWLGVADVADDPEH